MEQSVYSNKKRLREKIFCFFRETFRPHTKEEYGEFFSRGWKGTDGVNSLGTPWFYLRALAAFILLFAISTLILFYSENPLCYPTAIFFGGIMGNLPFLVLLYELYPKRDFSLFQLLAVVFVGGLVSIGLVQLGYLVYNPNDGNRWAGVVWIGFLEELTKAVPAIACVLLFKKRDPYFAFLIGAAVATGFSLSEDTGYIYYYSKGFGSGFDLSYVVYMGVERSLMAVCTHMPWTGIVCWAFAKLRRPLLDFRFYLAFLFAMALHACWDLPVEGWAEVVDIAACTLVAVGLQIAIVGLARRRAPDNVQLSLGNDAIPVKRFSYAHAANLVVTFSSVAACLLLLLALYFDPHEVYVRKTFADPDSFVAFAQDGLTFETDFSRAYEEETEDWEYAVQDGVKQWATQKVAYETYELYYGYTFIVPDDDGENIILNEDAAGEEGTVPEEGEGTETARVPVLYSVRLNYQGNTYISRFVELGEEEKLEFILINAELLRWEVTAEGIEVVTRDTVTKGLWECVFTAAVACVVLAGGVAGYFVLKRKNKKPIAA